MWMCERENTAAYHKNELHPVSGDTATRQISLLVTKMSSSQAIQKLGILYIVLTAVTGVLSDGFKSCTRYTSFGYGYRDFFEFQVKNFSSNQAFYLEFYVKTGSDAHILLKPDRDKDEGYEIVIGGGSNTFSQIRQIFHDGRATMITQKTENFLSPNDYKEFWISMDKLGIISVGKKENDEVFINWRFDNPLPVKLFSFGSWTNMKADWRFGCKKQNDSDSSEMSFREEGAASPLLQLKHDLFTLYDPNALPEPENQTLKVFVNFEISNIELNEKKGELTLYGSGILRWVDNKMKWKPDDYNGIETIYIPPFIIWTPRIRILNTPAMDKVPLFDLTAAGVMVKFDGSVFWRPPFRSVSSCFVDIQNWPFDDHNCTLVFGFWMEPPNLVMSLADKIEILPEDVTKNKWDVSFTMFFNTNEPHEDENFGIIYIDISRANGAHKTAFTISYIAATAMSLISFWLSVNNSLKLHLRCASVILLIIILFLLGETIPVMGQKVPYIINLYSWTAAMSCIPIILYVVLKNIQQSMRVPEIVSKILSNSLLIWVFCLPELPQNLREYANLNDGVNKLNKNRLMTLRLITVLERFFFLGYFIGLFLVQILL